MEVNCTCIFLALSWITTVISFCVHIHWSHGRRQGPSLWPLSPWSSYIPPRILWDPDSILFMEGCSRISVCRHPWLLKLMPSYSWLNESQATTFKLSTLFHKIECMPFSLNETLCIVEHQASVICFYRTQIEHGSYQLYPICAHELHVWKPRDKYVISLCLTLY